MGPTRWRKSTHVVVGAAVLAFVAVVVAAAALVTTGGHRLACAHLRLHRGHPQSRREWSLWRTPLRHRVPLA